MSILIGKSTSSVSASSDTQFTVTNRPKCVSADVLAGAETVTITYRAEDTATFAPVGVSLTATEPQTELFASGDYRVSKSATVGSCGVFVRDSART